MHTVLHSISEERQRRLDSRAADGAESPAVFDAALAILPAEAQQRLRAAYAFAAAVDYHHPGLSPASYLAHPVRVVDLALRVTAPPDVQAGVLSLLHNLYEVSAIGPTVVAEHFGEAIADAISTLTVNREDPSRAYVERYYAGIAAAPAFVRVVKVLDKLDNLFLLHLNPDAAVKRQYLDDVAEFVVPLAQSCVPALVPYLEALVTECRGELV